MIQIPDTTFKLLIYINPNVIVRLDGECSMCGRNCVHIWDVYMLIDQLLILATCELNPYILIIPIRKYIFYTLYILFKTYYMYLEHRNDKE